MLLEWYWLGLILTILLSLTLATGMPAGFAMGLSSAVFMVLFLGPQHLIQIANIAYARGTDDLFIVAPLFVLMASLVAYSGVAEAAYNAATRWLNRVPGSLAVGSTAACTAFAAVSGSAVATAVTIGLFAIPEMLKKGYDKRLAVGCVAAAGTLGILIPPSISMIIFGIITETSIGQLFIAGIIPGLITAAMIGGYIVLVSQLQPRLAPRAGSFTWQERFSSLRSVWGIAVLFLLVMGSMYTGAATPTEAAAIGATGAFLLMAMNRQISGSRLAEALFRSAQTSAMVMFLLVGGFILSYVVARAGIAHGLSRTLMDSGLSPWTVILAYNLLLIVLGTALETSTIIVITMPILFPSFKAMGFDPLWLGVLTTINSEIGTISPPAGLVLFSMKSVTPAEITMSDIMWGVTPFCFVLAASLIVMMLFPSLSTWLPSLMAR
ncbi:MAG: TRAP transporter large permease subunit [Deltaproteobacteria bacterium]|nr:TRAP transporter large permease subunit [Deltaproteobacteria bacterium]